MAIDLVRTYVTLDIPDPTEDLLAYLAERAAEAGEMAVGQILWEGEFGVLVRVAEGSAKTRIRIVAGIGGVVAVLTAYDGVFSGIDLLERHARAVGELAKSTFRESLDPAPPIIRSSIDTADVRRLRSVIELVQDGSLSADGGLDAVLQIIESSGERASKEQIDQLNRVIQYIEPVPQDATQVKVPARHIHELRASQRAEWGSESRTLEHRLRRPTRPIVSVEVARTVRVRRK